MPEKKLWRVMISARKDYWRDFVVEAEDPEGACSEALDRAAEERDWGHWESSDVNELTVEGRPEELDLTERGEQRE